MFQSGKAVQPLGNILSDMVKNPFRHITQDMSTEQVFRTSAGESISLLAALRGIDTRMDPEYMVLGKSGDFVLTDLGYQPMGRLVSWLEYKQ